MQRKVCMGELKYIVMDGCMLNKSSTMISENRLQREKKDSSSIQWCQKSDLTYRKTEKKFTN